MKTLDSHWKKREKYWKNRSSGPCSPDLKTPRGQNSEIKRKEENVTESREMEFGRNQLKMAYFGEYR